MNIPLLVATLVILPTVGVGAYFWHGFQVKRTAGVLLARADQLEQEEKWREAAGYVGRYVRLVPSGPHVGQARVRLATLSEKAGDNELVLIRRYYQTLPVAPPEQVAAIRGKLLALLLKFRRFPEVGTVVGEAAKELAAGETLAPYLQRANALAIYREFRDSGTNSNKEGAETIGGELASALAANPNDIELTAELCHLYREHTQLLNAKQLEQHGTAEQRAEYADQLMASCMEGYPQEWKAWFARYSYRKQFRLPGALEDLARARELGPDELEVLSAAVVEAMQVGTEQSANDAIAILRHIIEKVDVKNLTAYLSLGDIYAGRGQWDQATEVWTRGLETVPEEFKLALHGRLAAAFIDRGKGPEASRQLDEFNKELEKPNDRINRVVASAQRDLLEARMLIARGDQERDLSLIRKAIATLQRLSATASDRLLEAESQLALGNAYSRLPEWDRAAAAFDRAAALQPQFVEARVAAGRAWVAADQPSAAERRYSEALALQDNPETHLLLADARLQVQRQSPASSRRWTAFQEALAKVEAFKESGKLQKAWRATLLKADAQQLSADSAEAESEAKEAAYQLLNAAEQEFPDAADLLGTLVLRYEQLGHGADADRVLQRALELGGATASDYVLRSRLHIVRKQYAEATQALERGLADLPPEHHRELRQAMFVASLSQDDLQTAYQQLQQLQKQDSSNPDLMYQLGEMALEAGHSSEVKKWEDELESLEGEDGSRWRSLRIRRLIGETSTVDIKQLASDAKFQEAVAQQEQLGRVRPNWPVTHVLRGTVSDRQGKRTEAAQAYRDAVRLGERRVGVIQRLIDLMQSDPEVEEYLAMLRESRSGSSGLAEREIAVAARQGQMERAIKLAREATERHAKDPNTHRRLGTLLLAELRGSSSPDPNLVQEAAKSFREASRLDPKLIEPWSGLLNLYLVAKKSDDARAILEEVEQVAELQPVQRAAFLAAGYQTLRDVRKTESFLQQAAEAAQGTPQAPAIELQLARFYSGNRQRELAVQHARQARALAPNSADARRLLATLLALGGGESEWKEAEDLLKEVQSEADLSALDRRLRAVLLVQRQERLDEAQKILEDLLVTDPTATDRLLLARLYETQERFDAAREQYVRLAAERDAPVEQLVRFVEFFLRREAWQDAESWLQRLEQREPRALATCLLRCRWLAGVGRSSEISPVIKKFEEEHKPTDERQEIQLYLAIGQLYDAVKDYAGAKQWYAKLHEKLPENPAQLALALTKEGRKRDGIELCVEAAKKAKSSQPAIALGTVLVTGPSSEAEYELAEGSLQEALERFPNDPHLLLTVAAVRAIQGRSDKATDLYKRVLQTIPNNPVVLNNLATLLAEDKATNAEALEHINLAIKIVGPQPYLLDTKGTILIHAGKSTDAITVLEGASRAVDADPRSHFHLAVARFHSGDFDGARKALQLALRSDLEYQVLSGKDRDWLDELKRKLLPTGAL